MRKNNDADAAAIGAGLPRSVYGHVSPSYIDAEEDVEKGMGSLGLSA
jgi:hypothetical protein